MPVSWNRIGFIYPRKFYTNIANRRCVAFEELIDYEVDGILSTHEDLADSIACLMVNPNRDKMAERGRKKADRFSWEQLSRDIEKILEETERV